VRVLAVHDLRRWRRGWDENGLIGPAGGTLMVVRGDERLGQKAHRLISTDRERPTLEGVHAGCRSGRRSAASCDRMGGVLEDGGDVVYRVELARRYLHNEVISAIVSEGEPPPVHAIKRNERAECQPLVPIH
jgi:hypothetical protein